jgi:hypothetical protein
VAPERRGQRPTAVPFTERHAYGIVGSDNDVLGESADDGCGNRVGAPERMSPLAIRVHGEYSEMRGLRLTVRQAARLFGMAPDTGDAVGATGVSPGVVLDGAFALIGALRER